MTMRARILGGFIRPVPVLNAIISLQVAAGFVTSPVLHGSLARQCGSSGSPPPRFAAGFGGTAGPSFCQRQRPAGVVNIHSSQGTESGVPRILIVGGTGRIGTAVAIHLAESTSLSQDAQIVLAGRDVQRGQDAVQEVVGEVPQSENRVSFLQLDWKDESFLSNAVSTGGFDAVINTAGPYLDERPAVLKCTIAAGVPCYVDVADPLEYISEALDMSADAKASGTCALIASGAFPGFSNLLALEAAKMLGQSDKPRDVKFNYFTAGLGGSGAVNLYITNIGFGEPVATLEDGKPREALSAGDDFETVPFFIDSSDPTYSLIGSVNTWAWPFPEGRTVAEALKISGRSRVAMGTAPEIWNVIMGVLVKVVPRSWWRNEAFSQGLAVFSRPMVAVTDLFVGETHAIRVDVEGEAGQRAVALQGHESFRRCVGQSCAEFALHLMASRAGGNPRPGVYLPEQLLVDEAERQALVQRLSSTKGTLLCRIEAVQPPDMPPLRA